MFCEKWTSLKLETDSRSQISYQWHIFLCASILTCLTSDQIWHTNYCSWFQCKTMPSITIWCALQTETQHITSFTPVMLYAWPMIKPFGSSASSLPGSACKQVHNSTKNSTHFHNTSSSTHYLLRIYTNCIWATINIKCWIIHRLTCCQHNSRLTVIADH